MSNSSKGPSNYSKPMQGFVITIIILAIIVGGTFFLAFFRLTYAKSVPATEKRKPQAMEKKVAPTTEQSKAPSK